MAVRGWLLDKSAAARSGDERVGAQLAELAGSLFLCPVGELEQLYSARSAQDYDALEADLRDTCSKAHIPAPPSFQCPMRNARHKGTGAFVGIASIRVVERIGERLQGRIQHLGREMLCYGIDRATYLREVAPVGLSALRAS